MNDEKTLIEVRELACETVSCNCGVGCEECRARIVRICIITARPIVAISPRDGDRA